MVMSSIETAPYKIYAGPGSPYSHKTRAVFRYRRIPCQWVIVPGGFNGANQQGVLKALGKPLLPVVQFPDGAPWNDSTPIIHELELRYPDARSVLPPTPAERFLARLVEDYADEWLAVILMAFRWTSDEDVAFCARRQMHGWLGAVSEAELAVAVERFTARQQAVRTFIGGGDPQTHASFQAEYEELLDILEAGLSRRGFLFGGRPSIADFGLYGMLSQLAVDPTPASIMRARAMRTYQWVHYTDDLSGHEGEWASEPEFGATLQALVRLAGKSFLPMMLATSEALARREGRVVFDVAGRQITSFARPYTGKCWLWLKQMFVELSEAERESLRTLLVETGFWDALEFRPGEEERVRPFAMS
jgi:glutathione S-transferase